MDDRNAVLVARKEYTTILVYILYPAIYQGLKSIWEDAKQTKKTRPREVFAEFQNRLTRVRKWNQDVIENEYKRIIDKTKCDYLDELIKRVFVINTQILAAVNMHQIDPNKKIKVKVPKGDKFMHCVYKECARAFFENALLMEDRAGSISRVEQLKNLQRAYKLIMTCIENTIRNMLPIENLLKDSMENDEGEDATPPAVLFHNPRSFGQHFWNNNNISNPASPSQQNLTSAADITHPIIPSSTSELEKMPLSTFPTLSNFLQNNDHNKNENENHDHLQQESNNSLQPSMNDLGTIPLPTAPHNVHDVYAHAKENEKKDHKEIINRKRFDPNTLFDSTDGGGEDADTKEIERKDFEPAEINENYRNNNQINASAVLAPAETKTIFLGTPTFIRRKSIIDNNRPKNTDYNSQNSDESDVDVARTKKDIGGDDFERRVNDEVPIVRQTSPREKIDLDVYSSDNELRVKPSRFEDKHSIESHQNKVPPLENGDSANFFSDVD
jgi:hypothetical protein